MNYLRNNAGLTGCRGCLLVLCGFAGLVVGVDATASTACPGVEAHSLSTCSRCVSDDLCPEIGGVQYKCHNYVKKCVDPSWSASQVAEQCPEKSTDPSTWGAMCKLPCNDQASPFGCAANNCLNEDFPCHWVPGCSSQDDMVPMGLPEVSSACLRSCDDHDVFVEALYEIDSCDALQVAWGGCTENSMWQLCPVKCKTNECSHRCERDEVPDEGGARCYQQIERGAIDCIDGIKAGMDCHCKCGGTYLSVSGSIYRKGGGAFTWRDKHQNRKLDFEKNVTVGQKFSISLAGETMSSEPGVNNPARLKIVEKGSPCTHATNAEGVDGLLCEKPPGSDLLALAVCDTYPKMSTPWLHRWTELSVGHCGDFDVCHCNRDCNGRENWKLAGSISVRPSSSTSGGIGQVPPGCEAFTPTKAPTPVIEQTEIAQDALIKASLSIDPLKALHGLATAEVMQSIQSALTEYLQVQSILMGQKAPARGDIKVKAVASRLRRRQLRRLRSVEDAAAQEALEPRRRAASCEDDDAQFAIEAAGLGVPLATCADGAAAAGSAAALCDDAALAGAVAFCAQTCSACSQSSNTPAPTAPDAGGDGGGGETEDPSSSEVTTTTPPWPGGPEALRLMIEVVTHTDIVADIVVSRLALLETDPAAFVQLLYTHLQENSFTMNQLPAAISVFLAAGPMRANLADSDFGGDGAGDDTGSISFFKSTVFLVVASALGASCVFACIGVFVWKHCGEPGPGNSTRVHPVEKHTEVRETISRSDGGYRFKKHREEVETGEVEEADDWRPAPRLSKKRRRRRCGCLRSLCASCLGTISGLFAPKLRRPDLPPAGARRNGGQLEIGDMVQLCGLMSAPQYNGLYGMITGGPNESGRYTVDVIVAEDAHAREVQTKAFRPENLRLYGEDAAAAAAAANPRGADGGSWRAAAR